MAENENGRTVQHGKLWKNYKPSNYKKKIEGRLIKIVKLGRILGGEEKGRGIRRGSRGKLGLARMRIMLKLNRNDYELDTGEE
jgi:hypothetical protein